VPGPAHRADRIDRHDLAGDEPVEQVADRGEPLLDARRGELARPGLDPGGWCGFSTLDVGTRRSEMLVQRLRSSSLAASGKWLGSGIILQSWSSSLCEPRWQRCRFGRLLVSRIVARNDRTRTLTGILTSWSRGSG
jgi:hypothetical protein